MTAQTDTAGTAMLGMYDMPGVQGANDAIWNHVRGVLGRGPAHLDRTTADFWDLWHAPDLILGQTCGLPYRSKLMDVVQKVATPDYALPGCPAGYYVSVFMVRDDNPAQTLAQLSGQSYAFNEANSQSGWASPVSMMRTQGVSPSRLMQSGGHAKSLAAVAAGTVDFTGVDAQTVRLLERTGALPEGLRLIAQTPPTPGLPYICAPREDSTAIRAALHSAIKDPQTYDLGISQLVDIPKDAYRNAPTPPAPSELQLPLGHL